MLKSEHFSVITEEPFELLSLSFVNFVVRVIKEGFRDTQYCCYMCMVEDRGGSKKKKVLGDF